MRGDEYPDPVRAWRRHGTLSSGRRYVVTLAPGLAAHSLHIEAVRIPGFAGSIEVERVRVPGLSEGSLVVEPARVPELGKGSLAVDSLRVPDLAPGSLAVQQM